MVFAILMVSCKEEHTTTNFADDFVVTDSLAGLAPYKFKTDHKTVENGKKKVIRLYHELMTFKDNDDFHEYGFAPGYKYNPWLLEIESLRGSPLDDDLRELGYSLVAVQMIGLEYIGTKGEENEFILYSKNNLHTDITGQP